MHLVRLHGGQFIGEPRLGVKSSAIEGGTLWGGDQSAGVQTLDNVNSPGVHSLHRCSAGDVLVTLLGQAICARQVPQTGDVLISLLAWTGNRAITLRRRRQHRTNGPNEKQGVIHQWWPTTGYLSTLPCPGCNKLNL